ncbi:CDP-alcohol phosphatidyltransferase family protein [Methanobacterium sp. ACI-7]|uniref:CDP-alcohol phosphatidyltransferase family protein n=1 Tax=unclassified Methanobacterium TaxID=2627676 RepID=UPI0039C1D400
MNKKEIKIEKGIKSYYPSLITSLRIILLPLVLYLFFIDLRILSFVIFILLALTDVFDGYIARKMNLCSSLGAYFDTIADFILILSIFSAFVIVGIYPIWLLILIIFMFLQFVLTSKVKMPVYDPVGKYFGTFLYASAMITILFQNSELYYIILVSIAIFAFISLSSRYLFLFIRWRKEKI